MALLVSNVANKVTGFLIMLTVARLLGADRFGLYTAIFAYVSVFGLVTDLGLTTVVVRRLSQDIDDGKRWLGNALLMRWPLAIASYVICTGSALVLYGTGERTWLIAISALSFLLSPLSTHAAVFQTHLMMRIPAIASLVTRVSLLVGVQWLARHNGTLTSLIVAEVVLGGVNNVTVWLWSRTLLKPAWKFDWAVARTIFWEGLPLFLTSAFVTLYFRVDVFFLDHYRAQSEIGTYAAAYRLTESMPLIASALSTSIFPVLCQQIHSDNHNSLNRLIRMSLKVLLGMVIAIGIVLAFYSKTVIHGLYGSRFDGSAPLLAILGCNQILVYTNILLSTLLVARGESSKLMYLTLGMLGLNVGLNFAIIPSYGALGAAWTTMATEFAGTVGCLMITSTGRVFIEIIGRFAVPAALSTVILLFLSPSQADLSLQTLWPAAAVLLIYAVSIVLLRVFDADERERLRKLAWQ